VVSFYKNRGGKVEDAHEESGVRHGVTGGNHGVVEVEGARGEDEGSERGERGVVMEV
jgi:hypothetical protein